MHRTDVLFDGTDLRGWRMAGPGGFDVVGGTLVSRGGMGLLWYAERAYADHVVELEWRTARREDNSGVFVRFPAPGDDPWVAVHRGYEVQILDSAADPLRRTGAVYTFAAPGEDAFRPPGEWNRFLIRCVGHRYEVEVNGRPVTCFDGDRNLEGYVGIQNHDDDSRVAFRNIVVRW